MREHEANGPFFVLFAGGGQKLDLDPLRTQNVPFTELEASEVLRGMQQHVAKITSKRVVSMGAPQMEKQTPTPPLNFLGPVGGCGVGWGGWGGAWSGAGGLGVGRRGGSGV